MINREPLENNLVRIYSDKGVYIHGGFPEADYAEVIDPADVEREYTETDVPISQTEPESPQEPVTLEALKAQMDAMSRVQRGRTEINGEAITIAIDPVDPMAASVAMDVQGTDAAYAYSISEEALTVMFTEKVKAYINWEVRG